MKYLTVQTATKINNIWVNGKLHYNYFHNHDELDKFLKLYPNEKLISIQEVKLRNKKIKL